MGYKNRGEVSLGKLVPPGKDYIERPLGKEGSVYIYLGMLGLRFLKADICRVIRNNNTEWQKLFYRFFQ